MEKLIKFALSTKFGKNIEAIMDVIRATPNAEVATEILLGIYENPEIPMMHGIYHNEKDQKTNIRFVEYDRFTKEVTFMYQRIIIKTAWFKKDRIITPSEETIASSKHWKEDAARELKMSEEDFIATHERLEYSKEVEKGFQTTSKDLDRWIKFTEDCTPFTHVEVTDGVMI